MLSGDLGRVCIENLPFSEDDLRLARYMRSVGVLEPIDVQKLPETNNAFAFCIDGRRIHEAGEHHRDLCGGSSMDFRTHHPPYIMTTPSAALVFAKSCPTYLGQEGRSRGDAFGDDIALAYDMGILRFYPTFHWPCSALIRAGVDYSRCFDFVLEADEYLKERFQTTRYPGITFGWQHHIDFGMQAVGEPTPRQVCRTYHLSIPNLESVLYRTEALVS